jgi:hypothetical protein
VSVMVLHLQSLSMTTLTSKSESTPSLDALILTGIEPTSEHVVDTTVSSIGFFVLSNEIGDVPELIAVNKLPFVKSYAVYVITNPHNGSSVGIAMFVVSAASLIVYVFGVTETHVMVET